jgi:hypothetical protein
MLEHNFIITLKCAGHEISFMPKTRYITTSPTGNAREIVMKALEREFHERLPDLLSALTNKVRRSRVVERYWHT